VPVENSDWGGDEPKGDGLVHRPSDSLAPGTPGQDTSAQGSAAQGTSDDADANKAVSKPGVDPSDPHHHGEPGRGRKVEKDKNADQRTVEGTELLAPDWAK
jgi:hypothetical protein